MKIVTAITLCQTTQAINQMIAPTRITQATTHVRAVQAAVRRHTTDSTQATTAAKAVQTTTIPSHTVRLTQATLRIKANQTTTPTHTDRSTQATLRIKANHPATPHHTIPHIQAVYDKSPKASMQTILYHRVPQYTQQKAY